MLLELRLGNLRLSALANSLYQKRGQLSRLVMTESIYIIRIDAPAELGVYPPTENGR